MKWAKIGVGIVFLAGLGAYGVLRAPVDAPEAALVVEESCSSCDARHSVITRLRDKEAAQPDAESK